MTGMLFQVSSVVCAEEDFASSPFIEYGDFSESLLEDADTEFFQYGRFFGASFGVGGQMLDGNRSKLWQGGIPRIEIKVHYWFDFWFSLDLGLSTVNHFYNTSINNQGQVNVTLFTLGGDLRYAFDTRNWGAAISFINPYLVAGYHSYTKTQQSILLGITDSETSGGFCFGFGTEWALVPKRTALRWENQMHWVQFKDTYSTLYASSGIPDLTNRFYTSSINLLFTW